MASLFTPFKNIWLICLFSVFIALFPLTSGAGSGLCHLPEKHAQSDTDGTCTWLTPSPPSLFTKRW